MRDADDKVAWTWDRHVGAEDRAYRALEHIAYYLDRIEGHLATIAAAKRTDAKDVP
jgi:hypothetical protein